MRVNLSAIITMQFRALIIVWLFCKAMGLSDNISSKKHVFSQPNSSSTSHGYINAALKSNKLRTNNHQHRVHNIFSPNPEEIKHSEFVKGKSKTPNFSKSYVDPTAMNKF